MSGSAFILAQNRARRLYRSKGLQNAYVRGARAKLNGQTVESCPYKASGTGWRPAWRQAWIRGFFSVEAEGADIADLDDLLL